MQRAEDNDYTEPRGWTTHVSGWSRQTDDCHYAMRIGKTDSRERSGWKPEMETLTDVIQAKLGSQMSLRNTKVTD